MGMPDQTVSCLNVRVLVVENDERTRISHMVNLRRWGYHVILAEGVGDELLADAQRKVIDEACHIAVVDMRLYNDHDNADQSGLALIPKLKPALTIVVSGSGNDRNTTKKALQQGAFDFIGKLDDLDYLQKALVRAAETMGAGGNGPVVNIHAVLVEQVMMSLAPGKPEQIHEIFCSLFPSAKTIIVQPIKAEARTPKTSNRQRSFVFRVYVDDLQPVVVKIARAERITREAERYAKYIRNRVPGNFYAQGHQTVLRWHIGAVVYDFIGVDQSYLGLFQDYYKSASVTKLRKVLKHLFRTTWGAIYRQTRQLKELSLMAAYSEVWGHEWLDRMIQASDGLPELSAPVPDELRLLNPLHWILRRTLQAARDESFLPQTYFAVGHGDTLADNFFVDQSDQAWTIDYERTGVGPIIQDIVLLETDILVSLVSTQQRDLNEFLQLVVQLVDKIVPVSAALNSGNGELDKAYTVLRFLRQQADDLLDVEKERHYLWGMLLNVAFRLTVLRRKISEFYDKTNPGTFLDMPHAIAVLRLEQQRALLIGALICYRLDHWDKPWPPEHWVSFLRNDNETEHPRASRELSDNNRQEPIRILFVAANPVGTTRLKLEEEIRAIQRKIRDSEFRDALEVIPLLAARAQDLLDAMNEHKPRVVHFSGHGIATGEILLIDRHGGNANLVKPETLRKLFSVVGENVQLVMLNACYSEIQAQAINSVIDYTVGMNEPIDDDAAILFAARFYGAAGFGRDIQNCYEQGKLAIELDGFPDDNVPVLLSRSGCNPSQAYLLKRSTNN